MSDKFTTLTPALHAYAERFSVRDDAVLARLAAETAALGDIARMQVAADEGALLTLLVRAIGARSAVEIGTFTGYSGISIARGLPGDGRLLCCDISEEWTAIARRYFREAKVDHKIDLKIAPALDTLRAMPTGNVFDFAFVDGEKKEYSDYYEELLKRLRPGGLLAIDNVFWGGKVADPSETSEATQAIRKLNDHIAKDERVDAVMIPVADGLAIVRKR
ncbi:MAG TPA: class I SAM-dependent methyltransferase [Candidatus Binatia bacterium]|nr:class I SAM-dependent methyltransferase [Candidatus Binatia bacterium]